jgi:hypothetical protein
LAAALLRAKHVLAGERRFACCMRGGCGQCAHEAFCPCGGDLPSKKKGVCGDCLDAWRSGQGAFDGIGPAEVMLASPLSGGIGAQLTLYHAPPVLSPIYGTSPAGAQLFFRLRLK